MITDGRSRGGFGSLGVRASLLLLVAAGGLVAVLVGGVGLVQTRSVAATAQKMYDASLVPSNDVAKLNALLWKARWASISQGSATDQATADKFAALMNEAFDQIGKQIEVYRARPVGAAERAGIESFAEAWQGYLAARKQGREIKAAGKTIEYDKFRINTLNPASDKAVATLADLNRASAAAAAAAAKAARDSRDRAQVLIAVILVGGLLFSAALALLVARSMAGRLGRLRRALDAMAAGDLTSTSGDDSTTEIGQMSVALDQATTRIRTAVAALAGSSTGLASQAGGLTQSSLLLSSTATTTSQRAKLVDETVEGIATSVRAAASGAGEMGASIREIASNATEAALVATEAVQVTEATEELMVRLGASSREIGNVVKVITTIAEQTNLLALNATIEAARAGESGKGFAVVAGEVKDLAQETARATEEISQRVAAIQADAGSAVASISAISQVIGRINDYQGTIASAVEAQSATSGSMAAELNRAAGGTAQISSAMSEVVQAAEQSKTAASDAESAAHRLADLSDQIHSAVTAFRY